MLYTSGCDEQIEVICQAAALSEPVTVFTENACCFPVNVEDVHAREEIGQALKGSGWILGPESALKDLGLRNGAHKASLRRQVLKDRNDLRLACQMINDPIGINQAIHPRFGLPGKETFRTS